MVKPFDPDELLLKIIALLRRSYPCELKEIVSFSNVSIDFSKGIIQRKKDEIPLTATEFKILKYLYENKNHIVTVEAILERV